MWRPSDESSARPRWVHNTRKGVKPSRVSGEGEECSVFGCRKEVLGRGFVFAVLGRKEIVVFLAASMGSVEIGKGGSCFSGGISWVRIMGRGGGPALLCAEGWSARGENAVQGLTSDQRRSARGTMIVQCLVFEREGVRGEQ